MNKCVLITFSGNLNDEALQNFLQKEAYKRNLEGTVHTESHDCVKVAVCGTKEMIDQFVDNLYDHGTQFGLSDIEVEPFFKNKDFRGVFRILK